MSCSVSPLSFRNFAFPSGVATMQECIDVLGYQFSTAQFSQRICI
jgi:hypothetical protein